MTTTETNVRPGDILRATNLPSYAKLVKVGDILLVCREDDVAVDAKLQPKLVLAVVGDVKTALAERESLCKDPEMVEYDYDFVVYSQKYISRHCEVVKEEPAAASAEPAEQLSVRRNTRNSLKEPESVEADVAVSGVEPAGAPAIVEVEPAKQAEGEVESELVVALRAALGAGGAFAAPAIVALGVLSVEDLDCVDLGDLEAELGYKLSNFKRNVLRKAGVGASLLPSEGSAAAPPRLLVQATKAPPAPPEPPKTPVPPKTAGRGGAAKGGLTELLAKANFPDSDDEEEPPAKSP